MKMKATVIAAMLAFPMLASAQSAADLQKQVDQLKAQIQALQDAINKQSAAAAEAPPTVELEEFNRIKTKVEAAEDVQSVNGFKGLRISAGIDPTYIVNTNKNAAGFNFGGVNPNLSYDDSVFGVAYLDLQKEMEGGTKYHLTLMPTKSANSGASIVQEASASIPLTDAQTRLLVGQMPDVSGYEPWYPTYVGENNITSNVLYPTYKGYFVTHSLAYDFTGAYFYTGLGLDLVRGPWEVKLFAANMNTGRTDSTLGMDNSNKDMAFIYNATYAQEEFWGFEFTGYYAPNMATPLGGKGAVNSFEIDGNYTRGDFNGNLQFVVGSQQNGAYSLDANGNTQDSKWAGMSLLLAQRVTPKLTLATRFDYLLNDSNGGGTFANPNNNASTVGGTNGDVINGFGPDAGDATGQTGTNRYAISLAATYRLSQNVSLRAEYRRDFASTSAFYNYNDNTFTSTNNVVGLQAMVNF